MALNLDTLRAKLASTETRITELQHIERTEGAGRALPFLPDAMHERMELRKAIEALEAAAR